MFGSKLVLQKTVHKGAPFFTGDRYVSLFFPGGDVGFFTDVTIKDGDVYAWMPKVEGIEPVREFEQGDWVSYIETGDVFLVVKTDSRDTGWCVLYSKGESGEMVCLSSKELQIKYKHVDT